MASEVKHPFHPQHLLILESIDTHRVCDACGFQINGLGYRCSECECEFDLDFNCASMASEVKHPLHPQHILTLETIDRSCDACGFKVDGLGYHCSKCDFDLHLDCASMASEIKHPLHPQHLLILKTIGSVDCDVCGFKVDGSCYRCSQCNFRLDLNCSSLAPITEEDGQTQGHQIQYQGEEHPLICCGMIKDFHRECYACWKSFEDSMIYVCLQCRVFLHKSCAELAPIRHPYHPQHPLTISLSPRRSDTRSSSSHNCWICGLDTTGFTYQCEAKSKLGCHFYVSPHCASLKPTVRMSELHKHPLIAFIKKVPGSSLSDCSACSKSINDGDPFLRCGRCDFNLHFRCNPSLPFTIELEIFHKHRLTLTHSPVKDFPDQDEDAESYCDACEKIRCLNHPTYYCDECPYVAHVDCECFISEIIRMMEEDWSLACERGDPMLDLSIYEDIKASISEVILSSVLEEIDKETAMIGAEVEARKVELKKWELKLKEVQEKREQLISKVGDANNRGGGCSIL